jgi:hypothetical protein
MKTELTKTQKIKFEKVKKLLFLGLLSYLGFLIFLLKFI